MLFMETTAKHHSWEAVATPDAEYVHIESDINDFKYDTCMVEGHCPAVQLTRQQVQQHVSLFKGGLVGSGKNVETTRYHYYKAR